MASASSKANPNGDEDLPEDHHHSLTHGNCLGMTSASSSSKANPNWAEDLLEDHHYILTHGNYPKTRVVILSSDPQNDNKLVDEVLKKDARTDKVIYTVLPISDYASDSGDFKDEKNKTEFMEQILSDLKPTVILVQRHHRDIYKALNVNNLGEELTRSGVYDFYPTQNMTIVEPVILTLSVVATTDQVVELLKKMLKQNKIPNSPNIRVLWVDGSHGCQRVDDNGENVPVGGESGLSKQKLLNAFFYRSASTNVGHRANPTHFECHTQLSADHSSSSSSADEDEDEGKVIGDFIKWSPSAYPSFPRPDICRDAILRNPLPKNSLLNDPELNQIKYSVLNLADYHNRPELRGDDPATVKKRSEELLKDVEDFNPSVIFIGWCFSANGDVALALRASPIFSLMLLEHDIRQISNKHDAKLDPAQKEIMGKITNEAVRHCVLAGSSGTGKTLLAAEFVKSKAAKILRESTNVKLEIIVCRLFAGSVDESQLYQVWKDKYFQGVHGFNITYVAVRDLCRKFNLDYASYVDYGDNKYDMVGLITAVCDECDRQNLAKNSEAEKNRGKDNFSNSDSDDGHNYEAETSQTIFLLDEAAVFAVDNVSDFTQLAQLDKYTTLHSVTCVNPSALSGRAVFTVALPENCSDPCIKGSQHVGCVVSSQLNVCYRNTRQIRQFIQCLSDHGYPHISRENDKLGTSLPPGLTSQESAVTWVQCSLENAEKAAKDMINKMEQVDTKAEIVILFDVDEARWCSKIAHTVKGQHKVFDIGDYFGCESDVVIYITNYALPPEPLSRARNKLVIITGPDLHSGAQSRLKQLSSAQYSHSAECPSEPCPWSLEWTPLLEHLVVCGKCGEMVERTSEDCTSCGDRYVEPSVFASALYRFKGFQILG